MQDKVINQVKLNFTHNYVWVLRIIIIVQLIFLGGLIFLVYSQFVAEPKAVYFPLKKADQLIDSIPLEQPTLTDAELLNWITEAMIVSFSFNYHNYDKIIEKIEEYFDSFGIKSYLEMINKNDNIQRVVKEKLILSGRPTAAPRIIKDGVVGGRYAWEIELPFILRFNSQIFKSQDNIKLKILAVRVTEQVAPLGVKVVKIETI